MNGLREKQINETRDFAWSLLQRIDFCGDHEMFYFLALNNKNCLRAQFQIFEHVAIGPMHVFVSPSSFHLVHNVLEVKFKNTVVGGTEHLVPPTCTCNPRGKYDFNFLPEANEALLFNATENHNCYKA